MTEIPYPVSEWTIAQRVDWCLHQPHASELLVGLIRSEKARTAEVAASMNVCGS